MPQNFSPATANGKMSNGTAGWRIPKRSFSDMNTSFDQNRFQRGFGTPAPDQNRIQRGFGTPAPDQNRIQRGFGTPAPDDTSPSSAPAAKFTSAPVYNHGFVHDQGQSPPVQQDYFKCAEPKRAPSDTPDEPLKDLTPMQQQLEPLLPVTANFAVLPAKLAEKFSVSTCELCKVNMLSLIQTKMHYNGKPHMKKVRNFLVNECGKSEEPPVKIPKVTKPEDDLKNQENRECKVCKVIFNSSIHANQHYEGKKHKKAVVNQARSGVISDPRFGIGTGFPSASETKPYDSTPSISKPYYCELCNVQCSSSEQHKTHIEGARHAKNLRKVDGSGASISIPNFVDDSEAFAMFRTPSGKFYCHYCNYNGQTRKKFASHVQTDNHGVNAKKHKQMNPTPSITGFDLTEDEYVSKYEDY